MKRPVLVASHPAEEEQEHEERASSFPVFDRLRRERLAEEAGPTPTASVDEGDPSSPRNPPAATS